MNIGFWVEQQEIGSRSNTSRLESNVAMALRPPSTHTNRSSLCAAAYSQDVAYLGVDLENWLSAETVQEAKNSIISAKEEALLKTNALDFDKSFTPNFSAKESQFKALYPSVGYYFDFMAAEITHISLEYKRFNLVLLQTLTPQLTSGTHFSGQPKACVHRCSAK